MTVSAIELLYDFLEDHVRAAAAVIERQPLFLGVVCWALGGTSVFMAQALAGKLTVVSFTWAGLGLSILWKLALAVVTVALLHLFLEMQGAKGSASALFVLCGMADLAWALAVPATMLAQAFMEKPGWTVTGLFAAIGLLSFSLKARAIQDAYHVSAGRAWMTLSLPYLGAVLAVLAAFSLAMASLFMQLVQALH